MMAVAGDAQLYVLYSIYGVDRGSSELNWFQKSSFDIGVVGGGVVVPALASEARSQGTCSCLGR